MQSGYLPLDARRIVRAALAALTAILIAGAAAAFPEPAIADPATGMTQVSEAEGWAQLAQPPRHLGLSPSDLWAYRNHVGEVLAFQITGATSGTIWGTDIYSDLSHVGTAAVHAGVLRPGETATIRVEILPGRENYQGSHRHGVTSGSLGRFDGSYRFVGGPVGGTVMTDPDPTPPEPTPPTTPTPPGVTQPGPAPGTFGTARPPTECGFGQRYCPPGDWGPGGCYSHAHAYCRRGKTCQRGYEICPPGPHGPGGCYRAAAHLRCIEGRICRFAESLCVPSDGSQPYCYLPGFGRCY